jgi:hypothetical protein
LVSARHFRDMPRYYFNIHNVTPSTDDVGEELPDNEAAWRQATIVAGEIFKDMDGKFRPGHDWVLEVTGEARKPIYVIKMKPGRSSEAASPTDGVNIDHELRPPSFIP